MRIIEAEQAKYLIKSLQHHPSPYVILTNRMGLNGLIMLLNTFLAYKMMSQSQ